MPTSKTSSGQSVTDSVVDTSLSGSFGHEVDRSGRRRQAPWSGPACTNEDCGSTRTKVRTSGRDEDERPLRERVCQDCGTAQVTIEVPVRVISGGDTSPVRFAEVDVEHRRRKRESKRRRFGWSPQPFAQRAKSVPIRGTMYIDGRRR